MLIQVRNRVLLLEAISYASIEFPEETSENDWIELHLIIDGYSTILYSDEALTVWQQIQGNATQLDLLTTLPEFLTIVH